MEMEWIHREYMFIEIDYYNFSHEFAINLLIK